MRLNVEVCGRPKEGETVSGDAAMVREEDSTHLLAVVDALGHGAGAARTADVAIDFLSKCPVRSAGVIELMSGLHAALRGTRGAAATLCLISDGKLTGCGVGNVALRCSDSRVSPFLTSGVLGGAVDPFRVFSGSLAPDARLVMFSDGISHRFALSSMQRLATRDVCAKIMETFRHSHDDATVLVADVMR
jgi:negative regulator of sigma-B (phosphoserine phosphatase)